MEILALALTFFVHVLGAGILIWALVDRDEVAGSWRDGWWPKDDDGDGKPPVEPAPNAGGGIVAPILPDAAPSPVRLREPGRIGDRTPGPARRPAHAPTPERAPDTV